MPITNSDSVPEVRILGSRVHLVSVQQAVDRMEQWISAGNGHCNRMISTGFHGLLEASRNPVLRDALNSAELWTPDGIAPVWLARLYGHRNVQRAPGADIMREFFVRANQRGYSSYFYGETEATLQALQTRLRRQFPGHRIVGAFSPPFRKLSPEEDEAVIERINAARPDVLWVGLGMPKQEHWIYERMHRLKVPVASGVGACFSFFAGTVRRCPDWVGRIGFEWAYRFLQEPKKLWRRDLIDGPRFLLQLGLDLAGLRRQS
jgi:N-acetylglucosaminyldiphosphoundecaprenol N-acetyl-beta-D-mannosaminyltransferase